MFHVYDKHISQLICILNDYIFNLIFLKKRILCVCVFFCNLIEMIVCVNLNRVCVCVLLGHGLVAL